MFDILIGFLVLVGTGTCGLAVRDLWDAARGRLTHGRRKDDLVKLRSHYEAIEAEWDALNAAQRRLLAAKKGGHDGSEEA